MPVARRVMNAAKPERALLKDNLNRVSKDPDEIEGWRHSWPGCAWGRASKNSGLYGYQFRKGKQGMKSPNSFEPGRSPILFGLK
jgi:hypothetical protein